MYIYTVIMCAYIILYVYIYIYIIHVVIHLFIFLSIIFVYSFILHFHIINVDIHGYVYKTKVVMGIPLHVSHGECTWMFHFYSVTFSSPDGNASVRHWAVVRPATAVFVNGICPEYGDIVGKVQYGAPSSKLVYKPH